MRPAGLARGPARAVAFSNRVGAAGKPAVRCSRRFAAAWTIRARAVPPGAQDAAGTRLADDDEVSKPQEHGLDAASNGAARSQAPDPEELSAPAKQAGLPHRWRLVTMMAVAFVLCNMDKVRCARAGGQRRRRVARCALRSGSAFPPADWFGCLCACIHPRAACGASHAYVAASLARRSAADGARFFPTPQVNMSVAVIPMARDLGWSATDRGLVSSSFFWGYSLTQVPAGWISTRRAPGGAARAQGSACAGTGRGTGAVGAGAGARRRLACRAVATGAQGPPSAERRSGPAGRPNTSAARARLPPPPPLPAPSAPPSQPPRIGGAKVLAAGVALWSFGTLIAPPAAHMGLWALCATRVLVGLGEGFAPSAATSVLARQVPSTERSRAVTTVWGGLDVGSVVGLLLSGPLIRMYGWPSVFYLFAVLGGVWCLFWPMFRPELEDPAVKVRCFWWGWGGGAGRGGWGWGWVRVR
jgi:MFS family permease